MNVIGIIAEYNPFHNGHLYQINKIKEMYPDSLLILVLNGYFTQRGDISLVAKEDKVRIALDNKIDIVLELPFIYGTQSSDIFAYGSVYLLNKLKVDKIIFGSETNDIELLKRIADMQLTDEDYDKKVKEYLAKGLNYTTALSKALNTDINKPNDLLGLSYIKAIKKINPNIQAECIKRTNEYHDITSDNLIVSASNIREKVLNKVSYAKYIPFADNNIINKVTMNDLYPYLQYKIKTDDNLAKYLDVDEGIEYRLKKCIDKCHNYDELVMTIKTKRYTYNKIRRMLLHILVGLTKENNNKKELTYLKILGFNDNGQKYINQIKKDIDISLNVDKDTIVYQYELLSAFLYDLAINKNNCKFDLSNKPIIDKQSD